MNITYWVLDAFNLLRFFFIKVRANIIKARLYSFIAIFFVFTFSHKAFAFSVDILDEENQLEYLSYSQAEHSILPKKFSVLVWNIFKANRKAGLKKSLPFYVQKSDIRLIQEYESNDFLYSLFSNEDFAVVGLTHTVNQREDRKAGVLISSRIQTKNESCQVLHTKEKELGMTPKASLSCFYKLSNGDDLLIINVHALNFQIFTIGFNNGIGFGQAYRNQVLQWESLIRSHQGPVIIAGDFNTWNPLKRRLKNVQKMLYRQSDGSEEGSFKKVNFAGDFLGAKENGLDHMFYRGLKLIGEPRVYEEKESSDHHPLFAQFETL